MNDENLTEQLRAVYDPFVSLIIPGVIAVVTAILLAAAIGVYTRSWVSLGQALVYGLLGCWFFMLLRWFGVANRVERSLGITKPDPEYYEPETAQVRLAVYRDDRAVGVFADLQVTPEQLQQMARALIGGATFSENTLSGRGAPFTRSEFRKLRTEFLNRGLAVWRNPRAPAQGLELTPPGRAAVRFLSETTNPQIEASYDD